MDAVSYLTINEVTREIVDKESRSDIALLKEQIAYIAEQLNIDISKVKEEN